MPEPSIAMTCGSLDDDHEAHSPVPSRTPEIHRDRPRCSASPSTLEPSQCSHVNVPYSYKEQPLGHTTLGQLNATNMCVFKHVNANAGEHCIRDNLTHTTHYVRNMNNSLMAVVPVKRLFPEDVLIVQSDRKILEQLIMCTHTLAGTVSAMTLHMQYTMFLTAISV